MVEQNSIIFYILEAVYLSILLLEKKTSANHCLLQVILEYD